MNVRSLETGAPPGMPAFFDRAPAIVVHDALAALLGASADGRIVYRYADAVRLSGHSCPTVAGGWLMTRAALARLYRGGLPQRGGLRVAFREREDEGVTGVIAAVAGLVTGAAGRGGFPGLAGRHARRGLLSFGEPIAGEMRVARIDTGDSVTVSHHPGVVARPPDLTARLQAALAADAGRAGREAFAQAWQGWVRAMLEDHADDPALITIDDEAAP